MLVVLNWKGQIIGASAWCPSGYCPVPSFYNRGASIAAITEKYNEQNHDLLGVLQFLAKAIEVWFVFVAVSLIYMITVLLARMRDGLPIGYLTTYMEFSDLRILFDPVFWTASHRPKGKASRKRNSLALSLFVAFAAFMCLLVNLMGPSCAVLIIPTLQWRDTPKEFSRAYTALLSELPPAGDYSVLGCTGKDLEIYDFSCTAAAYEDGFDSMIEYTAQEISQVKYTSGPIQNFGSPASVEGALTFEFNATTPAPNKPSIFWAPNRQVIRELSVDYQDFARVAMGNVTKSPYVDYNNSLSLILQRDGPIVGFSYVWNFGAYTTTAIDDSRAIRFYRNWTFVDNTEYAKCYRVGWSVSDVGSFNIGNVSTANTVLTRAISCDKAVYIKTPLTEEDHPPCFVNGTLPPNANCNWDDLFNNNDLDIPDIQDLTTNLTLIEYSMPNGPIGESAIIAEVYTKMGFATYSVDMTTTSTQGVVQIPRHPDIKNMKQVLLSPAWILAAWSVKLNSVVPVTRGAAFTLQQALVTMYNVAWNHPQDPSYDQLFIDSNAQASSIALYSILQALTLIPYNYAPSPSTSSPQYSLYKNFRRQVWAYGFDSRSSKLGLVVVLAGIFCVLLRTLLGIVTRIRHREPVEMVAAAMQHRYKNEFWGVENNVKMMAKTRFRVRQEAGGGMGFEKRD